MGNSFPLRTLNDMVLLQKAKAARSKDSAMPYVGLEHMVSESPDLVGWSSSATSISTNSMFERDDVLFGKLRPNLRKCVLAPFPGYCSTDILVLRPRNGVDPSFAAKALQSDTVFRQAVATAIGTKMPRTSWGAIQGLHVFCPGEFEQRRIAAILDNLDDTIRRTEAIIAKLKQIKQGLLSDLLTRGIDESGELRSSPVNDPDLYEESPLGPVPKEWAIGPFSSYASPRRPFLKTGPFGTSLKGEHWVDSGVPVITIGALGEGSFTHSELLHVSERTAESLSAYVVEEGDIVFSRVADVGRSVVVSADESGWIMSSNLMWISLDPTKVRPHYVWLNLSANAIVRAQVRRSVNAGGRDVANGAVLQSLVLAWPDYAEQGRIVDVAHSLSERVRSEQVVLAKLRATKSGLSDDLLSGHVRVKVAEGANR